jgi:hypothetical protein
VTADVIDPAARDILAIAGGARPAFPEIPQWVPPIVASFARDMRVTDPHHRQILVRLATDPRMRNVWLQLVKRDRKTGRFCQPALIPSPELVGAAAERQNWAMTLLFSLAFGYAVSPPSVTLRRELENLRAQKQELARKLREQAEEQYEIEHAFGVEDDGSRAEKLDAAAEALEKMAEDAGSGCIVVERDRGLGEPHALAVRIAERCQWLFGSPLYTVTATFTSVALDAQVSDRQVREWWSSSRISGCADKG